MGTAHAGTQGLSAEQKPHPRHTHLPAEASQSALTGDACGHSRQRSCPRRVPEPPSPSTLELVGREWNGQEVLLQELFAARKTARRR